MAHKVAQIFGRLLKENFPQELSKIAQSSHTVMSSQHSMAKDDLATDKLIIRHPLHWQFATSVTCMQCNQIGLFLKGLGTKFSHKISPNSLAISKFITFKKSKSCYSCHFWNKNWLLFIQREWSRDSLISHGPEPGKCILWTIWYPSDWLTSSRNTLA